MTTICAKCGVPIHLYASGEWWVPDRLTDAVYGDRHDHQPDVSVALAGHTAAALDHITGTTA